jgi:thiamine-monophosphate kinase
LDINKYGMNILKDINQEMGDSGEEYEMLVGFQKRDKEEILSIARALNLPLNIFAEVAKNRERFPCKSHHFQ